MTEVYSPEIPKKSVDSWLRSIREAVYAAIDDGRDVHFDGQSGVTESVDEAGDSSPEFDGSANYTIRIAAHKAPTT